MYKINTLLLVCLMSLNGWAQHVKLTGKITSSENNKPISNVNISIKGATEVASISNNKGVFSIILPNDSTKMLVFSHQDFDTKEVSIDGQTIVNVELINNKRYNQYGQKVDRHILSAKSRNGIISFESEDKNYKLWLDNRVYIDGATYFDNYNHNLSQEENLEKRQLDIPSQMLKLRKMCFAIKAIIGSNWYGEIDVGFDGMIVDIKDVYLGRYLGVAGSPWAHLRIGQFRMPQGMQHTTTSRYLKLMERASVAEFNPNRRIGVEWASWNLNYMFVAAVHTEEIRNLHDTLESAPYYFKGELQGAKTMLGFSTRGAYYIFNEPGKLFSVSSGLSMRTPGLYKYPDHSIKYNAKDETNVSELAFTVAKISGVKSATNINLDAAVSFGAWRMTSEYHANILAMKNGTDPVNFSEFYVQSAYLLTGENHPWNHREAEFTQVKPNRKSGVWEVAARYSYINLNDLDQGIRGGQKGQYTVGVNYYASRNVKFMLNFSYVNHDKYSDGSGYFSNYVNQDPASGSTSGYDYSMLTWRCEIDF